MYQICPETAAVAIAADAFETSAVVVGTSGRLRTDFCDEDMYSLTGWCEKKTI